MEMEVDPALTAGGATQPRRGRDQGEDSGAVHAAPPQVGPSGVAPSSIVEPAANPQPQPTHTVATAPRLSNFDERYRQAAMQAIVNWDRTTGYFIHIPGDQCKSTELAQMCEDTLNVIHAGRSVAVAASGHMDTSKVVNAKDAAMARFTSMERAMFNDWENGLALVPWDFAANASPDPIREVKVAKYNNMAAALEALYKVTGITALQAKGWAVHNQHLMPLCIAMGKIHKAQRNATGGELGVDARELLEKRVLKRIQGLIGRRRNKWEQWWRTLSAAMKETEHALQVRMAQLENAGKGKAKPPLPAHHVG